jgi:hypothetical protein
VRTILYYQGESDAGAGAAWQSGFTALRSDWLQDYPSLEGIYVFQVREGCGPVNRFDVDLRNRQRLLGDQFANVKVLSTTGLDGHDGCHYSFTNGYQNIGLNMARVLQRDLYGGASLANSDAPNAAYAVLSGGASKNVLRIPLRNRSDAVTFASGAIADFALVNTNVSIVSGSVSNGVMQLNLSGNASAATSVVYTGHAGPASGNWVTNANGIGLLCFIETVRTDTTPPVITLVGANPVNVNLGQSYTEPGATASDNLDGNITGSIVINSSAVNTSVAGDYSVTYNVSDVAGNAATQVTRTVHVNGNGAPTANAQSVTTNEDTAKAITLTGSDPNGDPLTFSVVTGPSHGALSGTAPNLTYTPTANYNGADSFTFWVNDGTVNSNTATVSITVTPVNDAPVANAQSVTTNEDTAKGITLTATDVDGDALTYSVVTGPAHGALSGTAPNLTYTPSANYNGSDSFTFKVNDGKVDSNTATVSITVTAVNDAPVANAQSVTTNEDTAKAITLTATDVDGDPLTYSVVAGPAHGAVSGTAPNLTYTPTANYNGLDSFTFKANDGTVNSNTATVSITVTPVNDAPVANPQSVTTNEDTAKAITLTATDVDGDTLTYSVVTGPAHGTLSGTAPTLTYTPAANYNGPDSFTFKANDGTIDSNTATISFTVTAVNDAPVADPQSVTTNEDTAKAITLTATDVDGDTLTYSVVTGPTHGTLSGTAPTLTYTPAANYNGPDSFTFKANDGTIDSSTATVSITVTPVNDPPVANAQSVTTNEDTAKAITLTATDVDGDPLTYSVVTGPTHGALSGTLPNLTYTPVANYNGPDSFTFKANDGTIDSNTATVSITVTPVNDPPVANAQSVTTNEDTAKAITLTATDVDGDTLTYSVVTGPTHGALSGTAPTLTYTPAANYNGPDSFTFKANDGTIDSSTATVSITVTPVNDPPVANAQSVTTNEDTAKAITLTATDVDGDTLTYSVVTGPLHGALNGTLPNLTYTPTANYNGPDSFTFKANDGTVDSNTATISITVTPVNDPPVANAQSVTTNEDTAKPITLTATDVDGDTLTYTVVTGPAHGALSGTAPILTYTPTANYNGPDSFTFKANDGTVDSNTATISITVTPVNDAPVANAESVTTNEDTAKAIVLTATDVDGDTLTYSVVTGPSHGALSGTAPDLTYTPSANYHGADAFTFKANDGTVDSNIATVSITVDPVNDAPIADAQSATTSENTAKTITLTGSDVDGDTLTFSVVTDPAHGVLSGTPPNLTYTPAANYVGADSFTFKANDGTTDSNVATVSITVDGVPEIAVEEPAGADLTDGLSTVDFGDVIPGGNNSHTFTIKNTGSADLTGLAVTFDGTNAGEWTLTASPAVTVAAGGSTTFTVQFSPAGLGGRTAALHISSNDADESPFDIALTGTGITNLEAWRLQYFGSIDNSGDGADDNDFDSDGLSNLLEFATGSDPKQNSPRPGELILNGETMEFLYTRAKGAISDGIVFTVEWSDDLTPPSSWSSTGVTEEMVSQDSTTEQWRATVPAGTNGSRYLRLKVLRP